MGDTGAPHFIPYVEPTDLVRDYPAADEAQANAVAAALSQTGGAESFNESQTITSSDAAWPVPVLASPIVKVTIVGAGGSGGGRNTSGSSGGSTTFNAGEGKTFTAIGGLGGARSASSETSGRTGRSGFAAGNNGTGRVDSGNTGGPGTGGQTLVQYVDLTDVSTVNITIGAGGGSSDFRGGGGSGSALVEFRS